MDELAYTANIYSEITLKTVNQLYIYSTVLGAAIKCKQYSEITVESGTHLKSVKITLNIFAVYNIWIWINQDIGWKIL